MTRRLTPEEIEAAKSANYWSSEQYGIRRGGKPYL